MWRRHMSLMLVGCGYKTSAWEELTRLMSMASVALGVRRGQHLTELNVLKDRGNV